MKMKLKQTWMTAILGASLLSACTPNPSIFSDSVQQGSRPPAPAAKPAPAKPPAQTKPQTPKKPPAVSRTLPLPKEPSPQVEVLQHRQDEKIQEEGIADDEQEPEVLEVKSDKKYDSSPAARALVKQADTEIGQGKLAVATSTIERALRIEPDNPDLWMKLSELHKRQGNNEQAASMAAKADYYQEQLN